MKNLFSFVFIGILFLASYGGGAAWAYDSLYIFGDSLSDQGNFYAITGGSSPPQEYSDGATFGRFTNGKNYVDYLDFLLGISSSNSLSGGNNYAYGGARTDSHPQASYGALSLLDQVAAYNNSRKTTADPGALYIVWAGANNLKDILMPPSGIPMTQQEVSYTLTKTASDMGYAVETLADSGAKTLLVPNLPDLGIVPIATGGGSPNEGATLLSQSYNSILAGVLSAFEQSHPDVNLIRFDTFALVDDVYYNPAKYGLSNVTTACYSAFVEPGGTLAGDPADYLSWDGFHPTTAAHQILADSMYSTVVPLPSAILLFCPGAAALLLCKRRIRACLSQTNNDVSC